ncbi:MAG: DUF5666 domain-containing protein [Armatimonadetes bacterium]|nr:DUF5666 domain-containing protein [Armatimonadota bacterium]
MKRILVGLALIAAGFLGGLLAQPPQPPGGPGFGGPGFSPGDFARRIPFAGGTVAQVQGNTIVVEASFGGQTFSRTVVLTNQTRIQRSQPGTKADIKANSFAIVRGQPDPKSGWMHAELVVVMPDLPEQASMVVGRIYDVRNQGNQFGVNVPISVRPEARVYKITTAKASEIKQGDQIFVRGRPDESTGNLVAEEVIVGEMPPLFGPGGPRGFGGPGGFGGQRGFRSEGGRRTQRTQ